MNSSFCKDFNPMPLKSVYLAIELDAASRERLLNTIKPIHPRVIAHHITIAFIVVNKDLLDFIPGSMAEAKIVAHGSNSRVQAVMVAVNGTIVRPDSKNFHVTLSLVDGAKPVESNYISEFLPVDPSQAIALTGEIKLLQK